MDFNDLIITLGSAFLWLPYQADFAHELAPRSSRLSISTPVERAPLSQKVQQSPGIESHGCGCCFMCPVLDQSPGPDFTVGLNEK